MRHFFFFHIFRMKTNEMKTNENEIKFTKIFFISFFFDSYHVFEGKSYDWSICWKTFNNTKRKLKA